MLQRGVELHHLLGQQDGKGSVLVGGMRLEPRSLHQPAVGDGPLRAALMWRPLPGGRGLAAAGQLVRPRPPRRERGRVAALVPPQVLRPVHISAAASAGGVRYGNPGAWLQVLRRGVAPGGVGDKRAAGRLSAVAFCEAELAVRACAGAGGCPWRESVGSSARTSPGPAVGGASPDSRAGAVQPCSRCLAHL